MRYPYPGISVPLRPLALAVACSLGLSACMVGPDYVRPQQDTGITYKEAAGWKQASPQDNQPKGPWWTVFNDKVLNQLMSQVQVNNQDVAEYAAEYREALAAAHAADANLYPSLDLDGSGTRSETGTSHTGGSPSNDVEVEGEASWEVDLWGKLRRTSQEEKAAAEESKADLDNATLSAQTSLAEDYFKLRILDERIALYADTVKQYQRYVQVTRNQYQEGQSDRSDVSEAQAELDSAEGSRLDLVWQRAQYEHAIALLIGKPPSEFSLAKIDHYVPVLPDIPLGLPSSLLERRPDIAAAERKVAAANAEIGVNIAGYYPDITLSASGGYQGGGLGKLFQIAKRFWSIGPSLTQTLFDGGETSAKVAEARAAYDADVASYRQTVLEALGSVEDNLSELGTLDDEIKREQAAANGYQQSARVTYNQYRAGDIDYLDVATTQASYLNEQQSVLELLSEQLTTSVDLITDLGGGWHYQQVDQLPEHSRK